MSKQSNKESLSEKYSVITFATNKMTYVQFAMNCAQSVLLHNDLPLFIVSNLDFPIPEELKCKIFIIPAKPEHVPLGIGMKLYIDEYVQTEHTLFIDSDCICFGDLNKIFDACKDTDVSVAGNIVPAVHWCGPVQAKVIKDTWGFDEVIRFNGGLYYIKRSALAKSIFDKAREIAEKYDDYGFHRINGKWINEEGPLSIAMMLYNQKPMGDNGRFMTDLYTDQRPRKINVLKGALSMRNPPPPFRKHRAWYPAQYSPIVLHFGGSFLDSYPYKSQNLMLKLKGSGFSAAIAGFIVNLLVHAPYRSYYGLSKYIKTNKT
ncbi:MAG: hypothetical protein ACHQHN_13775 [Sphingobacteriales bacterium]